MRSHSRMRPTSKFRTGPVLGIVAIVVVLAIIPIWLSQRGGGSEQSAAATLPKANAADSTSPSNRSLSELDKTFLTKVRQAGLWEIPAGRMAQTHTSSEAVKRAGMHLLDGHSKLDQLVREDAAALNVQIPDQPTAEQQGWLDQLKNARGAEFDRLFANLLRSSHGKVFIVIGEVRAASHNILVRRLATEANNTVQDHMQVLEDTGLVDPQTLDDVAADIPK